MDQLDPVVVLAAQARYDALPIDTKERRAALGLGEPDRNELASTDIELSLLAAGWPAHLMSRAHELRPWRNDRLALLRESPVKPFWYPDPFFRNRNRPSPHPFPVVALVVSCFDDKSRTGSQPVDIEGKGKVTYRDVYGAGCDDEHRDYLSWDGVPLFGELAILRAVFPTCCRDVSDLQGCRNFERWKHEGGSEPNFDAAARSNARHRFTGWVDVDTIVPNRLWRTYPTYGPAGYVRFYPKGEEPPNLHVNGGSYHLGTAWCHYIPPASDKLLIVDKLAKRAVAQHRLLSAQFDDLPAVVPFDPSPLAQASLF